MSAPPPPPSSPYGPPPPPEPPPEPDDFNFVFAPSLVFGSRLVPLPRPIMQIRIQDTWDAARFKVPHRDGSLWAGRSRDGVEISIRGQLGRDADGVLLSERAMFESIEAVRDELHLNHPDQQYGLALFVDSNRTESVRGFRACSTVKLEVDLSERAIYGYTLLIHASDPTLITGAAVGKN